MVRVGVLLRAVHPFPLLHLPPCCCAFAKTNASSRIATVSTVAMASQKNARKPSVAALRNYQRSYCKKHKDGMDRYHVEIFDALQRTFFSGPPSTTTATTRTPIKVLYPGCHRHITPSLVFSDVTYVDCDHKVGDIFDANNSIIQDWMIAHKQYGEHPQIRFVVSTYKEMSHPRHNIHENSYDLLISLSAGIVTEDCLLYLRPGGLYLVNAAHADAYVAFLSPELKIRAYWNDATKTFCQDPDLLKDLFLARSKPPPHKNNNGRKRSREVTDDKNSENDDSGQCFVPLTKDQVAEAVRIGTKNKRSFVLKLDPMVYVFEKVDV